MNTHFKTHQKTCLFIFLLVSGACFAEPYLAIETGNKCSACHVNPVGGGMRNSYGSYYGTHMLPQVGEISTLGSGGDLGILGVGGDARFNYDQSDTDDRETKTFNTQSTQLYLSIVPKKSKVSLYIDQQLAPGASLNREAYVQLKTSENHFLKIGRMLLPYGIRIEDDSAFIRQATQINFDNGDNGVEFGMEYEKATANIVVSNGTSGNSNNDDKFQIIVRGEYVDKKWRLGSSLALNDSESETRTMANIFGGARVMGVSVLAELDMVRDEDEVAGTEITQQAALVELNKSIAKGVNVKLTSEYLDPDRDIDNDERTRNSLLLEYTPYAHIQFRGGVRIGDDIPQREQGNFTDFFLQAHMYY